MKRFISITIGLLVGLQIGLANMASPVTEGSLFGSPFISHHVTILSETIRVIPQYDFLTATFEIEYELEVDSPGTQIPLLFYAIDYEEGFQISLNGKALLWQPVPPEYQRVSGTPFSEFSETFEASAYDSTEETVSIFWNQYGAGTVVRPQDLFYFETDMEPGKHLVRVSYIASPWEDRSDWVNEYSFRYSLSPASYWKEMNQLTIEVDATQAEVRFTTNLGRPGTETEDGFSRWVFDTIPVPEFWVQYQPEISDKANFLIRVGPWGITWMGCALGVLIHFLFQIRFRRKHFQKKINPWVWIGGIAVPVLVFLLHLNSYGIIDQAIGAEAGQYHGYAEFVAVVFLILLLPYLGIAWLVDRWMRRQ